MKCLAAFPFLLFATTLPLAAQQIKIDITATPFANSGSPDPQPEVIGTVSSSPAGAGLLTLSASWIDFYTGNGSTDCTDSNSHAHSMAVTTSSTPMPLTICIVLAPVESGASLSFITATPAAGNGLFPVTIPLVVYVIPTGTVHIDQVQLDVSGGSASVTVTEDSATAMLQGNPPVQYVSAPGWLQEIDTCSGVHATVDGPGICQITMTANPNAPGLSPGAQYWANVHVSDGVSAADFSVLYTYSSPLKITSPTLFRLSVNQPFSTTLTAAGGAGGYGWSATGLPSGLQITAAGVVSGTVSSILSGGIDKPQRPLAHITAQDSAGNFGSQTVAFAALAGVRDKVGIFRGGFWALDANGSQNFDGSPPDSAGFFGQAGDVPVIGDWTGTGVFRIGVFRQGEWFLDLNGNNQWDGPGVDLQGSFGLPSDIPVVGDWDGSRRTKVGVFRNGEWYLDLSGTAQWPVQYRAGSFGLRGDIPVVGDWDGSGTTKVGVYRNGEWHLDLSGTAQWSPTTDLSGDFGGLPGDTPVVGKWAGSFVTGSGLRSTKVGVYRNGQWHLNLSATPQWSPTTDRVGSFGLPGDVPVVGDWDGSGETSVGVYRDGAWHLDVSGIAQWNGATDLTGSFGALGDTPVVGNWLP